MVRPRMLKEAVNRSIKLTKDQIAYIESRSDNLSGYIRAMIDREIGSEADKIGKKDQED
jgi:hypothetical protein